jgi:HlyD family secretion protein
MNKRLKRRLWLAAVAAVVFGAIAYGLWPRPLAVDVAVVQRGPLQVTVNEDGKTRVRERYVVSSPVAGQLQRIELHAGDTVTRGATVLALVEPTVPTLLDARLLAEAEAKVRAAQSAQASANATVERAKEARELAEHNYERAQQLWPKGTISREQFDQAEHQAHIARAEVRTAEFNLQVAAHELELAQAALLHVRPNKDAKQPRHTVEIVSPVNGRMLRVFQESASVVTAGTRLLEVGDPTDLEMEIDVLSTDAVRIRPGAKVLVEHWGGAGTLNGLVRTVEPSAFLKVSALGVEEQRVNIIANFIDPLAQRETLGDGYRVEAKIIVWQANDVLKVPSGCLFRDAGRWAVFRVARGRAQRCAVEVGESNGLETEIRSGLDEDEIVILHPSDQVHPGIRVHGR